MARNPADHVHQSMRLNQLIVAVFPALAAALLLSACGSIPELTLREYYVELDRIFKDTNAQTRALEQDPVTSGYLVDPAATAEVFRRSRAILDETLQRLRRLNPPEATAQAHRDLMASIEGLSVAYGGLVQELNGVSTPEEMTAFADALPRSEASQAAASFRKACTTLQSIAENEAGIAIDLMCDRF
jgi:hypothetical protein